jgi:hypothetical protein
MLINIVAGLITAAMLAVGGLVLRHRKHFGLLRTTMTSGRLRVSVAALLRIKDDDGYVLIHHPFRPPGPGRATAACASTSRRPPPSRARAVGRSR